MATEVPVSMNRLLLIRVLAFIDLALGFISFLFQVRRVVNFNLKDNFCQLILSWQVGLLANYGFPSDAAGIWCGIFFIVAGFSALFALRNSRNQK
jgi:hypothetical protein